MLNTLEQGVCQALDRWGATYRHPLVIVCPWDSLREANNMVAASLPVGSYCTGSSWVDPEGHTVKVRCYGDEMPAHTFDLEFCGSGSTLTSSEVLDMKRWRGDK